MPAREKSQGVSRQVSKRENLASWRPVPVRLVDTVMPRLKDTELRVLLVVLRQTWGWRMYSGPICQDSKTASFKVDYVSLLSSVLVGRF